MESKNNKITIQDLHSLQENHHKNVINTEETKLKSETWFLKNTVDYWRHKKIRDSLLPIIKHFPESTWLTVGDGRYGTDANYLLDNKLIAHASDIQDELLKIGNQKGFIKDFSRQNAEKLSFPDSQFDFVYCKESYHHFPRPAIAVYEMLRVAKVGIILQEPKDSYLIQSSKEAFFYILKKIIKILLLRKKSAHKFENSGNYLYSLSPRELQKYALGLHYKFIAYKVQQDYYIKGVEFEKNDKDSKLLKRIKTKMHLFEFLYKIGLFSGGIITGVILKDSPSNELIKALKKEGYKTEILPQNPYL